MKSCLLPYLTPLVLVLVSWVNAPPRVSFSGQATMRPSPRRRPPLELSGHIFWGDLFLKLQQNSFFLVARPLPYPPPFSGRATKKVIFTVSLTIPCYLFSCTA